MDKLSTPKIIIIVALIGGLLFSLSKLGVVLSRAFETGTLETTGGRVCEYGGAVCNTGMLPASFNFQCTWEHGGCQYFVSSKTGKTVATNMPCFIKFGVSVPADKEPDKAATIEPAPDKPSATTKSKARVLTRAKLRAKLRDKLKARSGVVFSSVFDD